MKQLQHFIKDKSKNREDTHGDYIGGAVYQREQVKKRGKAVCKTCGKVMHNTPKGWADECYDCSK